jgi:hypothetical protein
MRRSSFVVNLISFCRYNVMTVALTCMATFMPLSQPSLAQTAAERVARRVPDFSVTYEDATTHLRVIPGPRSSTLLAVTSLHQPERAILLPGYPGDVEYFEKAPGGLFLVVAKAGTASNHIYIVDVKAGRVVDHFLCSSPVISPNHRYIAYIKFFPERGVDEEQSSHFAMLYDVGRGDERQARNSTSDPNDVGRLLFPPSRLLARTRRGGIPVTHYFPSGFAWSPDSTKLLFLDNVFPGDPISNGALHEGNVRPSPAVPPSPAVQLILVDLTAATPTVSRFKTERCRDSVSEFCQIYLRGVRFGAGSLTVALGGPPSDRNPVKPSDFDLTIPYAHFTAQ